MPDFLKKYSAYIVGFGIIGFSLFILLSDATFATIPDFVWMILNAIGFVAIREAVNYVSENDNRGWKTYVAAAAILILGLLKMFGIEFPIEILAGLEGLGLIGLKNALDKINPVK